jgi:hypothetical protein
LGHAVRMNALEATDAAPLEPPPDDDDLDAVRRATALLGGGDTAAARKVAEDALAAARPGTDLLWVLADIEFADGDLQAGMRFLMEAAEVDGQDGAAFSRKIKALSSNRLWRDALFAIEHVSAHLRNDPLVRESAGDFYRARRCPAHSVDAYGDRAGLSPAARTRRLRSWVYSGGPIRFLRSRIAAWEESALLIRLRSGRRASEQLADIPELTSREAFRLNALIDSVVYEWW